MPTVKIVRNEIRKAWTESAPLTAVSLLMLGAFVAFSAAMLFDYRTIGGVPAWLKPAKFAISTAIYTGTLAWILRYTALGRKFAHVMGWVISVVLVIEVAIIGVQAARGTTSHFNVSTPLDTALWSVMGTSIAILWLASVGILIVLFRQKFRNPAWGWALRLGLLTTVVGSGLGGLMVGPTSSQMEAMRAQHSVPVVGAHTVGAPDGGPGLPGVGWSTDHGDLRIPHFFGMHGVQIIALLSWIALRRRNGSSMVFVTAASYIALLMVLTWQALRGQSIVAPDEATLLALAAWLVLTATAVILTRGRSAHQHSGTEVVL